MKKKIFLMAIIATILVGCKTEEPEKQPTAKFSFSTNELTVTFTNESLNAQIYYWDFGDGSASSETNPKKTYSSAGTYKVTLKVVNVTLSNSISKDVTVSVAAPTAKFSYSKNELKVTFSNQSTNADSYSWDFGDGQTSTQKDPTVTYKSEGTYSVSLTAKKGNLSDTYTQKISVAYSAPTAKFSYSKNELKVTFSNQSTNADSYSWDFGDGQTSTQKDPTVTYKSEGTYSVSLTAKKGNLSNTCTQNVSVAYSAPTASFTYKTEAPLTVILTNTSTNGTSYEWDFGDGKTSSEKNPTHRYSKIGSYIITLVTKNSSGSQQYRQTVQISAPKVFVKGIIYNQVGKTSKYYKSVCKDDDLFTNTWWNTSYTPMLTDSNLPYSYIFSSPVEMTGLSGDNYYTVYVYWNNTTNGDGTQILKQKLYVEDIKTYPEELGLVNDNSDTYISVLFEYK